MVRACRFSYGGSEGAGEWTFDGSQLTLSPENGSPISVAADEISGIAGDGYTVDVTLPGDGPPDAGPGAEAAGAGTATHLILSRLGTDGSTLLEELRRTWLAARAEVLRLGGSGQGKRFYGRVAGLASSDTSGGVGSPPVAPDSSEPFQALLFEDVMVVARDGRDLDPLFIALFESVAFDEASYSIRVRQWPGREIVFSKMAGQTDEFVMALRAHRTLLATESASLLASAVPGVPAGGRAALAGTWLPGRLMEVKVMDSICKGFAGAFKDHWLQSLPRSPEGHYFLDGAASASPSVSTWLGAARGDADAAGEGDGEVDDAPAAGEADSDAAGDIASNAAAGAAGDAADGAGTGAAGQVSGGVPQAAGDSTTTEGAHPLWMLSGMGGVWFLEALSIQGRATYCFRGGNEVPVLVSQLLCAPQFSKEALYSPLDKLTGDNASLAIPAQCLSFLVELRRRFAGRVIHRTADAWRKGVEQLVAGGK